jgi:hypothetical protein
MATASNLPLTPVTGPRPDMSEENDLKEAFRQYVVRFDTEVGLKEFGQFGTWERRLVKKLRYEEFVVKWKQFREMEHVLKGILERGDTINDAILHALRDCGAELVIRA